MQDSEKTRLFEQTPIPKAVAQLAIPTMLSALVMVLYNLADTYFVGMLNEPIENAAVTLAAPVLLAFNAVNNLFGVGGSSMMSRALGRKDYETVYRSSAFGANAVAAMGITQKINMVPMNISMGLSQGIMPLISYNYASGNVKRMKGTLLFAVKLSLGFILTMSAIYFLAAGPLVQMFMDNQAIIDYGTRFLRGFCLGLSFLCVDFLAVGVFQATGLGGWAFLFAIMRKIVLEIPALYILNKLFPLYGLAYAQLTAEVVLAVAAVVVLARLFRKLQQQHPQKEN